MNTFKSILCSAALMAAVGCGGDDATTNDLSQPIVKDMSGVAKTAMATINETGGAQGTVTFVEQSDGVHVTVNLTGVPTDGMHGMHLHATGDCSDTDADGGTTHHGGAGGHFNPAMVNHGCPPATPHHAGDLGNITIAAGKGTLTMTTKDLTVAAGANSVVGKAIILHSAADDCTTQPTGNSGSRIGCAVISGQ